MNDRFKVDIEAMTVGTIDVDPSDRWARQLGQIDLQKFLGSDISLSNPVLSSVVFDAEVIDPRAIRTITEPLINIRDIDDVLAEVGHHPSRLAMPVITRSGEVVYVNISDSFDRVIGVVCGSQAEPLQQDPTSKDLYAQLRHEGTLIDPRDVSDRVARLLGKVYGSQDALQQRATTKELIVQIQHQGSEKDPTQIRALTSADIVTLAKEGTATHFSITSSGTIKTPASGKKVRLLAFFWSSSADIVTSLRFASGGSDMFPLQKIGVAAMNLIGLGPLEGAADEVLYGYLSGAGTMKGTVITVDT